MFLTQKQKNNKKNNIKIINNNSGIALILTVIILTNLLMITLIITDVVLRIGKSSQQISEAEIAYLSAESAIEEGIYEIEKNKDASGLGVASSVTAGTLDDVDTNWERYIEPVYTTSVICVDANQKFTYYEVSSLTELAQALSGELGVSSCMFANDFSSDFINHSNNLAILLAPGKSFELDLDITVASSDFYPDHIELAWAIPNIPSVQSASSTVDGKIIVLSNDEQTEIDTNNESTPEPSVPSLGNFGTSPNHRIRIINNESSAYAMYLIDPVPTVSGGSNDSLPVSIKINSKGFYSASKRKERTIRFKKLFWQIY